MSIGPDLVAMADVLPDQAPLARGAAMHPAGGGAAAAATTSRAAPAGAAVPSAMEAQRAARAVGAIGGATRGSGHGARESAPRCAAGASAACGGGDGVLRVRLRGHRVLWASRGCRTPPFRGRRWLARRLALRQLQTLAIITASAAFRRPGRQPRGHTSRAAAADAAFALCAANAVQLGHCGHRTALVAAQSAKAASAAAAREVKVWNLSNCKLRTNLVG
eukprot:CAMPEP_0203890648 /NCGR_PEP_ID=MMETSP0359-20131031/34035_1 /ASSEMBLY_ACC=CAM_ASM_000338 /TAXON_ID=268821 /ORGANISM="Scrippsiella Hangoei, Strain SHTV-5" /LENGTH=219 /DNA_ID=CAMNT_0050812307 /DNA_START=810 /DNA_END=1465 /DNA_ORIENTATION=+